MLRRLWCKLGFHAGKVESEIDDSKAKGYRIYFKCAYCNYASK